jgi:prepilin peptidase CpaA
LSYPPVIVQILLALVVIVAAIWDVRQRRVPNWLTLPALAVGIGLNAFLYETPGLWLALKGLGLAMLIYFPLYLLRGMGAGDVKLMAAVGAIVGPANWLGIFVLAAVVGGVAAIVIVAAKGRFRRTFENIWMILMSIRHGQAPYHSNPELDVSRSEGIRLPHAVPIACGALGFLAAAAIWAPR